MLGNGDKNRRFFINIDNIFCIDKQKFVLYNYMKYNKIIIFVFVNRRNIYSSYTKVVSVAIYYAYYYHISMILLKNRD